MTTLGEQLVIAKDVWQRTGVLTQFQLTQLNAWNMCIFPNCKQGETHIDQDTWTIDFHVKPEFLASFRTPRDAPLRCAYVERWVHTLLDGRCLVRVFYGKTLIFTGTRTSETPEASNVGVDFGAGVKVPEKPWTPNPKIKY